MGAKKKFVRKSSGGHVPEGRWIGKMNDRCGRIITVGKREPTVMVVVVVVWERETKPFNSSTLLVPTKFFRKKHPPGGTDPTRRGSTIHPTHHYHTPVARA